MAEAIIIKEYGGPEVLRLNTINVGKPDPDEVKIKHTRIGVNFHDVYVRSGLYKTLSLPGIPGIEAVGVIEELGSQVSNFKPGDRIQF